MDGRMDRLILIIDQLCYYKIRKEYHPILTNSMVNDFLGIQRDKSMADKLMYIVHTQ